MESRERECRVDRKGGKEAETERRRKGERGRICPLSGSEFIAK